MLHKLRQRAEDEKGFTLIELLVVILIIGILAAIAIPSFINQRSKANDAAAKSYARTMQTADETFYTDGQTYAANLSQLQTIEPALNNTPSATAPTVSNAAPVGGYTVTATSKASTPVTFTITKTSAGVVARSCLPVSTGGCPASGTW
jgi:type IV pilus assembly protein PilA